MNREHAPGYDGIGTGTPDADRSSARHRTDVPSDARAGDLQRRALGSRGLSTVVAWAHDGRGLPLDPQRLALGSAGQARALRAALAADEQASRRHAASTLPAASAPPAPATELNGANL